MADPIPMGVAQGLAATQLEFSKMMKPTRKRRTKKKTTRARPKKRAAAARKKPAGKRAKTRRKKPARLVKGSAAAKRHMAKLRRMRKS